jgi:hypothetical protein
MARNHRLDCNIYLAYTLSRYYTGGRQPSNAATQTRNIHNIQSPVQTALRIDAINDTNNASPSQKPHFSTVIQHPKSTVIQPINIGSVPSAPENSIQALPLIHISYSDMTAGLSTSHGFRNIKNATYRHMVQMTLKALQLKIPIKWNQMTPRLSSSNL